MAEIVGDCPEWDTILSGTPRLAWHVVWSVVVSWVCDDLTCGSCAARRVVVGFNPENLNQLVVQGRGDGGLDEVTALLDPAQVRDYCLVTAHSGGCLRA